MSPAETVSPESTTVGARVPAAFAFSCTRKFTTSDLQASFVYTDFIPESPTILRPCLLNSSLSFTLLNNRAFHYSCCGTGIDRILSLFWIIMSDMRSIIIGIIDSHKVFPQRLDASVLSRRSQSNTSLEGIAAFVEKN